jgi:3-hydroxy-9,10-secoandrosta-1,3,5(10)-triene-9,17-dione monooxygenase
VHRSQVDVSTGTPGRDLHGNAEYCGGQLSYMNLEPAALAVGMAKGALDAYQDLLLRRSTLLPPFADRADDPDYRFWYGDAYTICRHVLRLCWEAVESYVLPTAGSGSMRHGERLERIWRDMSMMRSHSGLSVLLPTVAVRELARTLVRASP